MRIFCVFAMCLTAFRVYSQVLELNQVEVQGSLESSSYLNFDSSLSTETIDSKVLKETSPDSLDDILKTTPMATTNGGPRSSGEAPQIRGLNSQKLFLYIDGARQSFRADHSSPLYFEASDLKAVEIYKSQASSLKGNSLGGGLILKTKDASDYLENGEDNSTQFETSYQSVNREKKVSAKTARVKDGLGTLFSYTNRSAKNIMLSNEKELPHSSYEDNALMGKFSFDKISLKLDYFQRKDPTPLNPTLNPPENMDELNSVNDLTRFTVGGEYKIKSTTFNAYQTTQKSYKKRKSDGENEDRKIQTTGFSLKNENTFSDQFLALELEGYVDSLEGERGNESLESYPQGESQNTSLSSHYEFKKIQDLTILTGLRFDHYELESKTLDKKSELNLSKKLGLVYAVTPKLELMASYSEGFNAPKVQEVYADGLHHLGDGFFIADNYFIPNEDLSPERSGVIELGFKFQSQVFNDVDLLTFKYQHFQNEVDDYIYLLKTDRAIIDGENGTTQFINIPNVELYGDELSLEYLYENYSFLLTYGQIRGRDLERNLWISDLPADQFILKLQYETFKNYTFGYLGSFVNSQDRVNPRTTEIIEETPSYIVHTAFFKKEFQSGALKNFDILTRVENLTNTVYRKHGSNIHETGINLKIQVGYKLTI